MLQVIVIIGLMCMAADGAPVHHLTKNTDFDYFMFAQVWQHSMCYVANKKEPGSCLVPQGVEDWTVHGLWPSSYTEHEGPTDCDKDAPFDIAKISDMLDRLNHQWPNVKTEGDPNDFWNHEWTKHGTCAEGLPATSGEHNYFSKTLDMNTQYTLRSYLQQSGIEPSANKTYSLAEITQALRKVINQNIEIHCVEDEENGQRTFYIEEIRVCYDKTFQPIDCPETPRRPGIMESISDLENRHDGGKFVPKLSLPGVEKCPSDQPLHYAPVQSA